MDPRLRGDDIKEYESRIESGMTLRTMKILIIEDEQKIADSIRKGLEQESMVVDVAYDGEYGYDLASGEEYDVIVLDLMLPGMDGMEICRSLRNEKIMTPILMLTAKGQLDDKVTGLNSGADDYLVKPFAFEELLARIHALGRRPREKQDEVLSVGDVTLDVIRKQVKRAGKEIDLSSKEFILLEYLMRNQGQFVSKDLIIEKVWDFEADVLPNTVEVYIGYLRKKVDNGFEKKLIKTKRGFGYTIQSG